MYRLHKQREIDHVQSSSPKPSDGVWVTGWRRPSWSRNHEAGPSSLSPSRAGQKTQGLGELYEYRSTGFLSHKENRRCFSLKPMSVPLQRLHWYLYATKGGFEIDVAIAGIHIRALDDKPCNISFFRAIYKEVERIGSDQYSSRDIYFGERES